MKDTLTTRQVILPQLFETKTTKNDIGDKGWIVTLTPQLADYKGVLEYDGAGNANLTIIRKSDNSVILDFCLDNGEINEIAEELYTA